MYQPPGKEHWQGRTDVLDGAAGHRWHHIIRFLDLSQEIIPENGLVNNVAILGFCCDEGVRRNSGRVGARKGPSAIRKYLSNLAVHFDADCLAVFDAGDVICQGQNMEAAQDMLAGKVQRLLENGYQPIVLGGGHEVAFGHFLGIHEYAKPQGEKIGVINVDAHFDLRRYDGLGSSGTPFLQISELLEKENKSLKYLVLGINETANTRALFDTADRLKVQYVTAEVLNESSIEFTQTCIDAFIACCETIYLTIDMDAFNASEAPGVSAPAPYGVRLDKTLQLIKYVIQSKKVLSIDFAETNPELDIDDRTSKLVAYLIGVVVKELQKD